MSEKTVHIGVDLGATEARTVVWMMQDGRICEPVCAAGPNIVINIDRLIEAFVGKPGMDTSWMRCPTCHGSGEAEVGLIGFDHTWKSKCPDCSGTGKCSLPTLTRETNARRAAMGWPKTPPGGRLIGRRRR